MKGQKSAYAGFATGFFASPSACDTQRNNLTNSKYQKTLERVDNKVLNSTILCEKNAKLLAEANAKIEVMSSETAAVAAIKPWSS